MLFLSAVTAATVAFGFLLNGYLPFQVPISFLVGGPHPWAYHSIILSVCATLAFYDARRARAAGGLANCLSGSLLFLLLLLLFVDMRVQPAHDWLSASLVFLSSALLRHLSRGCDSPWLKGCLAVSLLSLPLFFTGDLAAIAAVELVVLSWTLVILNLSYYEVGLPAPSGGASLRDLLRSGARLRGYGWASYCVFFSGISGLYSRAPLAGVIHFALSWAGGVLSERFAGNVLLEAAPFAASGVGFIIALAAAGRVTPVELVFPAFAMVAAPVLCVTYKLQVEQAGHVYPVRRARP